MQINAARDQTHENIDQAKGWALLARQSAEASGVSSAEAALADALRAEQSRTAAQTARAGAETAQTAAGTARTGAEAARTAAQTAQTTAETARTGAQTAHTGAETAAGTATNRATEAGTSATQAHRVRHPLARTPRAPLRRPVPGRRPTRALHLRRVRDPPHGRRPRPRQPQQVRQTRLTWPE